MNIPTRQRQEAILNRIHESGFVRARDLAAALDVSEATARRDLKRLAGVASVQLVHGGATLLRPHDLSFRTKLTRNLDAKKVIGRLAAGLVSDGDTIFLDSGTTCFQMVPFLRGKKSITIIVNSARLALELDAPGLSTIIIGGQYRPARMDTTGPLAAAAIGELRGYLAFIGADGLSRETGLMAGDIESATLYRLAGTNARRVVLVADHSKFETPSLYKITDFDRVETIVTDAPPPAEWAGFFAARGITLVTPPNP
ncbi:MAG: DeoR/GlpR family DNA-binding transcription regulator [Planctomycetota bacterium]